MIKKYLTRSKVLDALSTFHDPVFHDHGIIVIHRQGEEDVALIAASELDSLMETAYLLRSPANAARLISALQRALAR